MSVLFNLAPDEAWMESVLSVSPIGRGRLLEAAVRLTMKCQGNEEAEEALRYLTERGPAARHVCVCPLPADDERLEDDIVRIAVQGDVRRIEALVAWDAPPDEWLGLAALVLGRFTRNLLKHGEGREFFAQPVGCQLDYAERRALEHLGRQAYAEAHGFCLTFLIDAAHLSSARVFSFVADARRRLGRGAFGLACLDWCLEHGILSPPDEDYRVQAAQFLGKVFCSCAGAVAQQRQLLEHFAA